MSSETADTSRAPREVVVAAGGWLGGQLLADGFAWLPGRLTLQRRDGTLRHQIHLQPDKRNRQGGRITVQTMLNVRDTALRRWRNASPDRVTRQDDYVCGHFLGYACGRANGYVYGDIVDGEIDLTDPGSRERRLQDWVAMVRGAVLPWFVEASDPDLIITSRAADKTSSPAAIIEWLASRSRPELIPAFLNHYLQQHPGWRDDAANGSTHAAKGQPLGLTTNCATELGWAAAHHTAT